MLWHLEHCLSGKELSLLGLAKFLETVKDLPGSMSLICKPTNPSPYRICPILSDSHSLTTTISTLITPGPISGQRRITLTAQRPPKLFILASLAYLVSSSPSQKSYNKAPLSFSLPLFPIPPTSAGHLVYAFPCGPAGLTCLLFLGECEYNKNFSHITNTRIHYF